MTFILDLAVGLIFVFLLFSLVVSAANELLQAFWKQRERLLKEGIGELLHDRHFVGKACDFYDHPLISAMSRKANGEPSYVPKQTFVSAVLDLLDPANAQFPRTMGDVRAAIARLGVSKVTDAQTLVDTWSSAPAPSAPAAVAPVAPVAAVARVAAVAVVAVPSRETLKAALEQFRTADTNAATSSNKIKELTVKQAELVDLIEKRSTLPGDPQLRAKLDALQGELLLLNPAYAGNVAIATALAANPLVEPQLIQLLQSTFQPLVQNWRDQLETQRGALAAAESAAGLPAARKTLQEFVTSYGHVNTAARTKGEVVVTVALLVLGLFVAECSRDSTIRLELRIATLLASAVLAGLFAAPSAWLEKQLSRLPLAFFAASGVCVTVVALQITPAAAPSFPWWIATFSCLALGVIAYAVTCYKLPRAKPPGESSAAALAAHLRVFLAEDKLKASLTALLDDAKHDLDAFKERLGDWFDNSMRRVTGWYKQHTQTCLFILGLILAAAGNVDTIHIMRYLAKDPNAAKALADAAVRATESARGKTAEAESAQKAVDAKQAEIEQFKDKQAPTEAEKQAAKEAEKQLGTLKAALAAKTKEAQETIERLLPQSTAPDDFSDPKATLVDLNNRLGKAVANLGGVSIPLGWGSGERLYLIEKLNKEVAESAAPLTDAEKKDLQARKDAVRKKEIEDQQEAARKFAALPEEEKKKQEEKKQQQQQEAKKKELKSTLGFWTRLKSNFLPDGTDPSEADYYRFDNSHCFTALLGFFITALAGSLGAPFWFDNLNKIITVRSSGKKPEEAPINEKAKDKAK